MTFDRSVLALLCPDWRGPTMVFNATTRHIEFANFPCLEFLKSHQSVVLSQSRFTFVNHQAQRNFDAALFDIKRKGNEVAVLLDQTAAATGLVSCILRYPVGIIVEVLHSHLSKNVKVEDLVIIEWSAGEYQPDPVAIQALTQIWGLLPSERKDLIALSAGYSAEAIAALNNSAPSTVRQRIKSILTKSNCSRQQQLIAVVRDHCPKLANFNLPAIGQKA
jgi:DNA-binding NarL/FixJ family response regulator